MHVAKLSNSRGNLQITPQTRWWENIKQHKLPQKNNFDTSLLMVHSIFCYFGLLHCFWEQAFISKQRTVFGDVRWYYVYTLHFTIEIGHICVGLVWICDVQMFLARSSQTVTEQRMRFKGFKRSCVFVDMGVSLNGGTPKTSQNDHF